MDRYCYRVNKLVSIVWLLAACGQVAGVPPDAGIDSAPSTFAVRGSVSGFAGRSMVLQLNGATDLPITTDGAFEFPMRLAAGSTYTVTVKSAPICPERKCTLTNATGSISGADASVTVACEAPKYRMVAHNWGEMTVRLTDDITALANNSTATPRIITGANTMLTAGRLDSVAYDARRDLVYAASNTNGTITVFANASTATGNIAPARVIAITGETQLQAMEIDAARDRLYFGSASKLYVLANASTQSGTVTPPVAITINTAGSASLDSINDRLYVGGDFNQTLFSFDNASALTSASTPTRTVTLTGWGGPPGVAIDACRDRLYLGSNNGLPGATTQFIAAFDSASTLNGAINPTTASQAQLATGPVLNTEIDGQGTLWYWSDSATIVRGITEPQVLTGSVTTVTPDKNISGVVASGYGLDVVSY